MLSETERACARLVQLARLLSSAKRKYVNRLGVASLYKPQGSANERLGAPKVAWLQVVSTGRFARELASRLVHSSRCLLSLSLLLLYAFGLVLWILWSNPGGRVRVGPIGNGAAAGSRSAVAEPDRQHRSLAPVAAQILQIIDSSTTSADYPVGDVGAIKST